MIGIERKEDIEEKNLNKNIFLGPNFFVGIS